MNKSPHLVNMNMFLQKGKPFPNKLDPKGKKGLVTTDSVIGYSKYTARKEASKSEYEKTDYAPGGYYNYTSDRFGATRTFTHEGWKEKTEDLKQFRNYVAKHFQDDCDILWIPVQSYKDFATASQYGLFRDEDYAEITKNSLNRFFKYVDLEPDNMIWWMNYHTNKNHPHVHLAFLEKNKTRTMGMFTERELLQYKRYILNEMKERERLILGTQHENSDLFKTLDNEQKQLKERVSDLIQKKKPLKIESMITTLALKLPQKGRMQYGATHMIPYREEIDSIVDVVLSHDLVKEEYQDLVRQWKELDQEYADKLHENVTNMVDAKDGKLRKQIANTILSSIKNGDYHLKQIETEPVSKVAHNTKLDDLDKNSEFSAKQKLLSQLLNRVSNKDSDAVILKKVGSMYEKGEGVDVSPQLAIDYYSKTLADFPESINDIARVVARHKMQNHYKDLEDTLRDKVITKDPLAMYWTARLYLDNDSSLFNLNRGRKLLDEAAELSDEPFIKESASFYKETYENAPNKSGVIDKTLALIKRNAKRTEREIARGREEYLEDGLDKTKRGKSR